MYAFVSFIFAIQYLAGFAGFVVGCGHCSFCLVEGICMLCLCLPVPVLGWVDLLVSVRSFVCYVAFVSIFVSFACSCDLCEVLCLLWGSCGRVDGICVLLCIFPW